MADASRDPLEGIAPSEFRGKTTFAELTPEQRLLWLAHAAAFAIEARDSKRQASTGNRDNMKP